MASRSFLSLFLQTREHLEVADRTQRFAVLGLLLFHLAFLWPSATAIRHLEQQEAESKALDSILSALEDSSDRLEDSHTEALKILKPALEGLTEKLRLDFLQLDAAVAEVRTAAQTNPEETDSEETDSEETAVNTTDHSDENANSWIALVDFPTVREAQNRYSLLTALEPLVDEHILAPRFAALTETWVQQTRAPFEGEIESLLRELTALHPRRNELKTTWDDLIASLGGLRRAILELTFTPPEHAYWWASSEETAELKLGPVATTIEELRSPPALDTLRVLVHRSLEHRRALEKGLHAARQDLLSNAVTRSSVGDKVLGVDLHSLLKIWPLLLGFLLAMVVLYRSHQLRQLGLLTTLMVEHGAPPNLSRWFLAEMCGTLTPSRPSDPVARRCLLRGLALLSAGCLWITGATLQAHGLAATPLPEVRLLIHHWPALVGATTLLLAVLHRLHLNGRLIDLLQEDLIEPPPELSAEEDEKEPFGIQDLRR
jgi:hypothetical protein